MQLQGEARVINPELSVYFAFKIIARYIKMTELCRDRNAEYMQLYFDLDDIWTKKNMK